MKSRLCYHEGSGAYAGEQWNSVNQGRWLEENADMEKNETEREICLTQKLINDKASCGLNSGTTNLWNLGIFPINSSKTTGLALTKGSASIQLPKILQTKQFGWQLDFHSLWWREAQFGLCLKSATVSQYTQDYSSPGDEDIVKNLLLISWREISRLWVASKPKCVNHKLVHLC